MHLDACLLILVEVNRGHIFLDYKHCDNKNLHGFFSSINMVLSSSLVAATALLWDSKYRSDDHMQVMERPGLYPVFLVQVLFIKWGLTLGNGL